MKENKHKETILMYWYPVTASDLCRITVHITSAYHIFSACGRFL